MYDAWIIFYRDRKRKKFVNESGKERSKKIKTESGTYIAASFKSNSYREWMDKHRIEGALTPGTDDPSGSGDAPGNHRGGGHNMRGRGGGRGRGRGGGRGRGRVDSEERGGGPFNRAGKRGGRGVAGLRTRSEILKKRRTQDRQQSRRGKKSRGGAQATSGSRKRTQ